MSEGKFELAKAYVQIIPSAQGIKGSIEQSLGGEGERAGKSIGQQIFGTIKKVGVALGVGKVIMDAFNEGGKLQQSIGGIETLFKENADAVIKNSKEAYKTAGMSANEYMETATSFSASLLQSLGGDTKKATEYTDMAIRDMSDNANKMGSSMESITDAYKGFSRGQFTLLDNLKLGYGGTKEEMQRLLTDAEAISGVHYDINSYSDIVDAIHQVQNELDITGTTARESASTLEGSMNTMKASWTNLLGAITTGDDVGTAMSNLAESVSTFLFDNVLPMIGNIVKGIPTLIYSLISEGIPNLLSNLTAKLSDILDGITESGVEGLTKGGTNKLMPALKKLLKQLLDTVITLAPKLLKAGISLMIGFVKGLGDSETFAKIKDTMSNIKDKILSPFESIKEKIKGIIDKIKGFFGFDVGKPHIPLPHFSISPSGWKLGDLLKGQIPSLGIEWYAKGGVFDSPSVIGVGEAGAEAVVPLDKFWKKLDDMKQSTVTNINFNGNYRFRNKEEIDYFMRESARMQRRAMAL